MVEKALAEVEKKIAVRRHYDNFIGGKWVPAGEGQKFENITPIDGSLVCTIARSTAEASSSRSMPPTLRRMTGAAPRRAIARAFSTRSPTVWRKSWKP